MQVVEKVAISSIIMIGTVAGFTLGGVFGAFSDGYFLGRERKKGVTYKTIARRNAALGGAMGALSVAAYLATSQKKEEPLSESGAYRAPQNLF